MRSISGMIFSVSLGQLLIGMKVKGNFLWKRLVYSLREALGVLLFPLIIFDFPALVGKRTFKEIITFTQYQTRTRKLSFLSAIIITPLLLLGGGLAPMIKGLEPLDSVVVNRVNKNTQKWRYESPKYLSLLNISYDSHPKIKVLPSFVIEMKKRKKILKSGILFIDLETGGIINIRKVKTFSLLDFYTSFVDLNYLAGEFQPHIHSFVRNVARKNHDFTMKAFSSDDLADETLDLVHDSYSISLERLPDFVMKNGIFMRGFRDFREKMDNLFSEKVQFIDLLKRGQQKGILASLNVGKNKYFEFIPVGGAKGSLYHLSEDIKSKKLKNISRMLYWGEYKTKTSKASENDPIIEYINSFSDNESEISDDVKQSVYESYFYVSKELLSSKKTLTLKKLRKELQRFLNVLKSDIRKNQKLIQNFSQLLQAIDDNNTEYFNIAPTEKRTI